MRPVTFERPGPLIQRPDSFRIRVIKLVPAVAPYPYQPNIAQHSQMFRHRRLLQAEAGHDFADRPLVRGQKLENLPSPRLCYRVEGIRGGRRSGHDSCILYSHIGICQLSGG